MIRASVASGLVLLVAMGVATAKPVESSRLEARRHYDAGLAHFNLREYPQAIEEFQAAYRLRPDPVFLYNLGQSYRLAENPDQALYFYRAYVRTAPGAPNRAEVDERIAALEKLIEERRNAPPPPAPATAPTETKPAPVPSVATPAPAPAPTEAATAAPTVTRTEKKPVYKKWWFWTVGAVVVAGAAVGLGVGLTQKATFDANVGTVGPGALMVRF